MAEDLTFELGLDTSNTEMGLDLLSDKLGGTDKQTKQLEKAMKDLEKTFRGVSTLTKSLSRVTGSLGEDTSKSLSAINKESTTLQKVMLKLGKAADATSKQFSTMEKTLSSLPQTIAIQVTVVRTLISALDDMTNPAIIGRLAKLSRILSFMLLAKGQLRLFKILRQTAQALDEVAAKLGAIRSIVFDTLTTRALTARAAILLLPAPLATVINLLGVMGKVANGTASALATFGSTIGSINSVLQSSVASINNLINIFNTLSDPARIKRLASLLKVLAAILFAKGQRDFARKMFAASDSVDNFAETLEGIKGESLEDLAGRVDLARKAFAVMDTTVEAAAVSGLAFAGLGLANTFRELGPNIDRSSTTLSGFLDHIKRVAKSPELIRKGFAAGFGKAAKDVQAFSLKASSTSAVLAKSLTPGIISTTEAGLILGPILFALGRTAAGSDNDFVRFAGTLTTVVAISLISFSAAITTVVASIGAFAASIGDDLIGAMTKFEEKAAKAQSVTEQFKFVLRGFAKVAGEETVGSLQLWEGVVKSLADSTTVSSNSLRKSVKLLVAEGAALGISVKDNVAILKRAADVAAATGNDVADVTERIVKGLGGNAEGLKGLGIFLDDATLAHSKFVEEQDLVVANLDLHQKAQLKLNQLMIQTTPLLGAAANELNTVEGATAKYNQAVEALQVSIGAQGKFTLLYQNTLTRLLTVFIDLPDAIKDTIGVSIDFLGVSLKVVGTLIKYSISIASLVTVMGFLSSVIKTNIVLQNILTGAFAFVSSTVGVQAVAVTSLSAAWTNLVLITKGSVVVVFRLVGQAALVLASKMLILTKAILTNPLFFKAAFVITAVVALIKAMQELDKEFTEILGTQKELASETEKNISLFKTLADFAIRTFKLIVAAAKLVVTGYLKIGKVVGIIGIAFKKLWAILSRQGTGALKAINAQFQQAIDELNAIDDVAGNAFADLINGFGTTAFAAKGATVAITTFNKGLDTEKIRGFSAALKKLGEEDLNNLAKGILGDEVDKVLQTFEAANLALNKARGIGIEEDGKLRAAKSKELLALERSRETARLEVVKLRRDSIVDLSKLQKTLALSELTSNKQLVEVARRKGAIELEQFRERVKMLNKIAAFTAKERMLIGQVEQAIKAATAAEVLRLQQAAEEERNKELEKQLKILEDIKKKISQINMENLKAADNEAAIASMVHAEEMLNLAALQAQAKEQGQLNKVLEGTDKTYADILDTAREVSKQKLQLALDKTSFINEFGEALDATRTFNVGGDLVKGMFQGFTKVADIARDIVRNFDGLVDTTKAIVNGFLGLVTGDFTDLFDSMAAVATGDFAAAGAGLTDFLGGGDDKGGESCEEENQCRDKSRKKDGKQFDSFLKGQGKNIKGMAKNAEDMAKIGKGIGAAVDAAKRVAIKLLAETIVGLANFAGALFDVDAIKGIADKIGKLSDLPKELVKAFLKLVSNLDKFIDGFAKAFDKLLDKLPHIIQTILNKLPEFIDKFFDAFEKLVDKLPAIFGRIFDALPDLLTKILERLPSLILKIFDAIGKIVGSLIKALPGILTAIFENLPSIISAIIEGVLAAIGDIIAAIIDMLASGGAEKIIGAFLRMIPRLVGAIVSGIWKGLMRAFSSIFNGVNVPEELTELPGKFQEGINKLAQKATEEAGKLFRVLDLEAAGRGLDRAKQFEDILDRGIQAFNIVFKGLIQALIELWRWVWNTIFKPFVDAMWAIWNFVKQVWDNIIPILQGLWGALKTIWDGVIQALGTLWAGLKSVWDGVIKFFNNLKEIISNAWAGVLGMFSRLKDIFDKAVEPLRSMLNRLKDIFDKAVEPLRSLLNRLKGIFEDAFKPIKDFLSNFKFPSISGGGGGGGGAVGTVKKVLGRNMGGLIPGAATMTKAASTIQGFASGGFVDSVAANLTPGEFVVNRDAVGKIGRPMLEAINKGAKFQNQGSGTTNVTVNVNIESKQQMDEGFIRQRFVPTILREIKDASLRGQFVLSQKGIRAT